MVEKSIFRRDYEKYGNNIGFTVYFKKLLLSSRISYLPDQYKFLNNQYSNYYSILSIIGFVNIEISHTKVIYQSINNPYDFIIKKL